MKKMMTVLLAVLPFAGFGADYFYLVPAAAHATGAYETNWRSDVDIYNPESETVGYDLILLKAGTDNSNPQVMHQALMARGIDAWLDILMERFQYEGAAAILIKAQSPDFFIGSRIYNDLREAGKGTYGQFVPGFAEDELFTAGQVGTILPLRRGTSFRSNLGLASLTPAVLTVTIEIWDTMGQPGGTVTQDVQPYGYVQINDILAQATSPNIFSPVIKVSSATPGAKYMAYASVIDNTSGDAIFVPAKK